MNSAILVLLTTNVWIFLYRFLVHLFNKNFLAKPSSSFLVPGVNPEPFETPLYILLTLALSAITYFICARRLLDSFKRATFLAIFLPEVFPTARGYLRGNKASPSAEAGGFLPSAFFLFASSARTEPGGIHELRNKCYYKDGG